GISTTTSNCTLGSFTWEITACRLTSIVNPSPVVTCATPLPYRVRPRVFRHNRRIEVRRVMRPTLWRPSTHLLVGVGVLAVVAVVVAATAMLTGGGRGAVAQVPPPPPGVTARPSIVPVA